MITSPTLRLSPSSTSGPSGRGAAARPAGSRRSSARSAPGPPSRAGSSDGPRTLEVEDPVRSEPRDLPQDQGLAHAGQPAEDERRRARPRIELRPDGGSVGLVAALQPDGPLEAEGPQEPHHGARSEPSAPAVQHDRARPQRDATLGSHPRVQCLDALGRGRAHHVDRVELGRLPACELTDLPHEVVDASLDQGLAVAEASGDSWV